MNADKIFMIKIFRMTPLIAEQLKQTIYDKIHLG